MSRGFGTGLLATLYALSADDPVLALLTITHADLTTRRYVRNTEDVTSRSQTFTAAAFDIELPEERGDQLGRGQLTFDAVNQSILSDLMAIAEPADVTVEIVFASDPDTVALTFVQQIPTAGWDLFAAAAELGPDPVAEEPYPGWTYSPLRFPGLFP